MSLENAFKDFELTGANYYRMAGMEGVPEKLSLRHMTIKEIKWFSNLAQTGNINDFIDNLLTSCVKEKDKMNLNNFLVGDRVYLFYMLRALTLGNQYEFQMNCQACDKLIKASVDLYSMDKKPYDEGEGYPLKIKLKQSGTVIEFILPTRGIEKNVEAEVKKYKAEFPNSEPPEAVYQLRKLIKTIDGENDFIKIVNFCDEMHILDWVELDQKITKVSPGLDLDIIVPCNYCEYSNKEKFSVKPQQFFSFGNNG